MEGEAELCIGKWVRRQDYKRAPANEKVKGEDLALRLRERGGEKIGIQVLLLL